ncbi:hypothetical protein ABPG72_000677 [Tetrahymena utriculariae]
MEDKKYQVSQQESKLSEGSEASFARQQNDKEKEQAAFPMITYILSGKLLDAILQAEEFLLAKISQGSCKSCSCFSKSKKDGSYEKMLYPRLQSSSVSFCCYLSSSLSSKKAQQYVYCLSCNTGRVGFSNCVCHAPAELDDNFFAKIKVEQQQEYQVVIVKQSEEEDEDEHVQEEGFQKQQFQYHEQASHRSNHIVEAYNNDLYAYYKSCCDRIENKEYDQVLSHRIKKVIVHTSNSKNKNNKYTYQQQVAREKQQSLNEFILDQLPAKFDTLSSPLDSGAPTLVELVESAHRLAAAKAASARKEIYHQQLLAGLYLELFSPPWSPQTTVLSEQSTARKCYQNLSVLAQNLYTEQKFINMCKFRLTLLYGGDNLRQINRGRNKQQYQQQHHLSTSKNNNINEASPQSSLRVSYPQQTQNVQQQQESIKLEYKDIFIKQE